ncbi:serine/threonine protein kinase [Rubrivivax sp. RP6-9]|uniref:serine/threonine protein kinase n=1 Tax=Rubrivivax sp. RP6-9 TaxID=3415750 RepID=UPI003CC6B77D
MFGRYQLLRLLGKSARTMAWLVVQAEGGSGRPGAEYFIVLPRVQPVGTAAMERWAQAVHRAARLSHPALAPAVEIGVQDGWPYAAYDAHGLAPLADRLSGKGMAAVDAATRIMQAAEGLAFAHEGGVGHHDLQPYLLLLDDDGRVRLAGLEVASEAPVDQAGIEPGALRAQRDAAQRDVLALGLLLHQVLVGTPALDEPDTGQVIDRLPPAGREIVRLPWTLPQPLPEPLRAIANRATDRQERQRYRNARTLARALEGWLQIEAGGASGPLALLQDKLRAAGVLPSQPGAAQQAARLARMETQHTSALADVVLNDLALAFELLRAVNTAQVRGGQVSGNGPVLTVRRAIAMLGLEGVRRAALALRPWPGPLNEAGAATLDQLVTRIKRAGRVALALRPAGYDGEVVYLVTLLQNLGRLVVQYHFADEAAQIRRLMQPAPSPRAGEPDEPGMTEEGAAFAVLGADIESIGAAVARHWGLDDSVLHMIRRLPVAVPVRHGDSDDDLIRLSGSAANEAVDCMALPAPAVPAALQRVVNRYGRVLGFTLKDLQAALQAPAQGSISAATAPPPTDGSPAAPDTARRAEPLPPGGLRAAAAARAAR